MKKFNFTGLACIDSELSRLCMEQIARLPEMVGKEDLHARLYNDNDLIRSYGFADKVLDELGVFNCVNLVLAYDREAYQSVGVQLNAPQVARMCVYIFGAVLLDKSPHYKKMESETFSKRDLQKIEAELQVYLESLKDDFSNVVFDEYGI